MGYVTWGVTWDVARNVTYDVTQERDSRKAIGDVTYGMSLRIRDAGYYAIWDMTRDVTRDVTSGRDLGT